MRIVAWRQLSLAGPGGGSNIYLYAHARDGMFITVWTAHICDEVVLTLVDGSQRRYVVSRILPDVAWNDMSVLDPTPTGQLSLQTCTSYQMTAPRLLVPAVPVPAVPVPAVPVPTGPEQ